MSMLYLFVSCLFLCVLFFFVSWLFRKRKGVEEKPMSDKKATQTKYDVFVSFRGEDIRSGFLSHLVETFQRNKINAFVDDKLEKGNELWESLVGAIEESIISLIIFSQDYASSRWCLDELATILECNMKYGGIVIPVFYHVKPTDVRHQTGSYKKAFVEHEIKYKSKVLIWRHALIKCADLSGIESSNYRNDAELLKEIVKLVLSKLATSRVISEGLVGIDEKFADIESLIRKDPKVTRLIGIWGMGGIGKTTFAKEIFNQLRCEYEGCYFLAHEREQSSRHGIVSLKREIFSGLLADVVKIDEKYLLSNEIDRRIGRMKVLIVLDDMNDSDHLEKLLGPLDNFGSGSRIIITTRDEQVLNANKADGIYWLGELSSDRALELFNLNAFNQSDQQWEYYELSKRVVHYAKGIPLVLKVLAHLLRGKSKDVWESELHKLGKMPLSKVYDVMKLSYDDLDYKEQQMFLDLACFLFRSHSAISVEYLTYLLKDVESDNSVVVGLERLKDKALVTFSENNFVYMHDILREMAWEIARRKSKEYPRSCSWLWESHHIYEAFKNDKGNETIRSIDIDWPTIKKQKLSPHILAKMNRLQFLRISGQCQYDCIDLHNVLAEGLEFLANELRYLFWKYYPLKSLPENFSAEKLVILKLRNGRFNKLWHGVKDLVNLKELDLTDSKELEELADLSKATNLRGLYLGGCSMLGSVHPSIFSLPKLEILDLWSCTSLTILSSNSHLCSLKYLNLEKCGKLKEFSLISENMTELRLTWTEVKEFPSSFGHQSKLELIFLEGNDIKSLPSSIKDLMRLSHLNVDYCCQLQAIPTLPPFLETLQAKYCSSLQTLPELPPSLKYLHVGNCEQLQALPDLPPLVHTLFLENCSSLQTLPELPLYLKGLYTNFCTSLQTLPEIPKFLQFLSSRYCTSLKTVLLFPSTAVEQLTENRRRILFWNCLKLDQHSLVAIALNAQINVIKFANQHLSTPNHDDAENYIYSDKIDHSNKFFYAYPGSCVPEWLEYKTTKDYIIIDLSAAPLSSPVGFIFCFVLGKYGDARFGKIEANITISDGEVEHNKESVRMGIDRNYDKIESDHLCVIYDQRCSGFLCSKAKNYTRLKIEVTVMFRPSSAQICVLSQHVFKGFGVSPISTSTYNSFIQKMELRDSMYEFN